MKSIDDEIQRIRRKNLGVLIAEAGNQAELGARLDVDSSYISQMNTGHRPIREKISRRLEVVMSKPLHWMDQEHARHAEERPGAEYEFRRAKTEQLSDHASGRASEAFSLDDAPLCGDDYLVKIPRGLMPGYPDGGIFLVTKWDNDPALLYLIVQLEGGGPVLMKAMTHRDVLGANVTEFAPVIAGKVEDDPHQWLKMDQIEILGALSNPVEDPRFRQNSSED